MGRWLWRFPGLGGGGAGSILGGSKSPLFAITSLACLIVLGILASTANAARSLQQQQRDNSAKYGMDDYGSDIRMVFLDETDPDEEENLIGMDAEGSTPLGAYSTMVPSPTLSWSTRAWDFISSLLLLVVAEEDGNLFLKLLCLFGIIFSLLVLLGEQLHWNPSAFQRFSVSTKVPIEIFCVTGPVVLLSTIIYALMFILLLMDSNTSSIFFLSASWTAILMDMTAICYDNLSDVRRSRDDVVLLCVNVLIVYSAFQQLRFVPYTFILCGLFFWAMVTILRLKRGGGGGGSSSSTLPLSMGVVAPGHRSGSP